MPGPSLMVLSKLLSQAPQGDPLARAALPAAQQEFVPDDPTRQTANIEVNPETSPEMAQPIMPGPAANPFGMPPPPVPATSGGGAPGSDDTQGSGGTGESKPGFFQSQQFR